MIRRRKHAKATNMQNYHQHQQNRESHQSARAWQTSEEEKLHCLGFLSQNLHQSSSVESERTPANYSYYPDYPCQETHKPTPKDLSFSLWAQISKLVLTKKKKKNLKAGVVGVELKSFTRSSWKLESLITEMYTEKKILKKYKSSSRLILSALILISIQSLGLCASVFHFFLRLWQVAMTCRREKRNCKA